MATKRDFKYLAILDHKSHLHTADNKKRNKPMKNSFNDVRVVVNGKNYFILILFYFKYNALFSKYKIYYRHVIIFFWSRL